MFGPIESLRRVLGMVEACGEDLGLTVNRGKSTLMVGEKEEVRGFDELKVVRLAPSGGLRVLGIPVGGQFFVRRFHGRNSPFFG